jgi:hypothetical protein
MLSCEPTVSTARWTVDRRSTDAAAGVVSPASRADGTATLFGVNAVSTVGRC